MGETHKDQKACCGQLGVVRECVSHFPFLLSPLQGREKKRGEENLFSFFYLHVIMDGDEPDQGHDLLLLLSVCSLFRKRKKKRTLTASYEIIHIHVLFSPTCLMMMMMTSGQEQQQQPSRRPRSSKFGSGPRV